MESYSLFAWFVNHSSLVTQSKQDRIFSLYSYFVLCPLCRNETNYCCLVKCLVREVYSVFVIKKMSHTYLLSSDYDFLLSSGQLVLLCLAIAHSTHDISCS